jgi:DNA polymerase-3 subunit delta'
VATAFASALMCQAEEERRPCGTCRACRLVAARVHPDLHVVESEITETTLKIDQVRALQHQLALAPLEARWRVAVLRRFEEATASAANALLKTLEEPPPYVVLMVLARSAAHLLPTIVSRCQTVPLHPLARADVERALVGRWGIKPDRAELLAHLSQGRLGWAVRAIEDEEALRRRSRRLDKLEELLEASMVKRFRYAEKVSRDPDAIPDELDVWISWWRDALILAAGADVPITNVDRRERLRECARALQVEQAAAMIHALRTSLDRLAHNANPRLVVDVLMLDLPQL